VLLAALILRERMEWPQLFGGVLVLAGVYAGSLGEREDRISR